MPWKWLLRYGEHGVNGSRRRRRSRLSNPLMSKVRNLRLEVVGCRRTNFYNLICILFSGKFHFPLISFSSLLHSYIVPPPLRCIDGNVNWTMICSEAATWLAARYSHARHWRRLEDLVAIKLPEQVSFIKPKRYGMSIWPMSIVSSNTSPCT